MVTTCARANRRPEARGHATGGLRIQKGRLQKRRHPTGRIACPGVGDRGVDLYTLLNNGIGVELGVACAECSRAPWTRVLADRDSCQPALQVLEAVPKRRGAEFSGMRGFARR